MEIKEVEKQLDISRSNIRFYEKQGLISPERRNNNYRDYSEQDILALKKIIILRKMGFTVEEIHLIQNGELPFSKGIADTRERIESEIKQLDGALNTLEKFSNDCSSFEEMNVNNYWNSIHNAELAGEKFIDIWKDWLNVELISFDYMWKYVFFHDFEKSRKRHGTFIACAIILVICLIRGLSKKYIWGGSFWVGFLYPFLLSLSGSLIIFPLYILGKFFPKVAEVIASIITIIILTFLAGIVLLLLYGIIRWIFI